MSLYYQSDDGQLGEIRNLRCFFKKPRHAASYGVSDAPHKEEAWLNDVGVETILSGSFSD